MERAEVELEDVGFDDLNMSLIAKAEPDFGGKRAVEFDCHESTASDCQQVSDSTVAWTHFDDGPVAEVPKRICNGSARALIDEEVLAQLWLVLSVHPNNRPFRCGLV